MLTRLRKRSKFFMLISVVIWLITVSCNNHAQLNIVEKMSNKFENKLIQKIYSDDIRDVYEMTKSKYIEIWYYEIDLNDNGYKDVIAIVRSPLHSGSQGDTFDIWINDGSDEYYEVSGLSVARILADNPKYNGKIYILDRKTNGFRNITILSEVEDINLIYEDGRYIFE